MRIKERLSYTFLGRNFNLLIITIAIVSQTNRYSKMIPSFTLLDTNPCSIRSPSN